MRCYGFNLKLWASAVLSKQGAVGGAVMFSTIVIFSLHSRWQHISSGMKSPRAQRDLCLCSGTREPEDMTGDCSPAARMEVQTHTIIKQRKEEFCSLHELYTHVESGEHVHMWTCSMPPASFSLSFGLSYPTHRRAHTSDATITAAMCTVNFKELRVRFRKHVTHSCLLGNVCTLLCDLFIRD